MTVKLPDHKDRKFICLQNTSLMIGDVNDNVEWKEIKKGDIVTMDDLNNHIVYYLCDEARFDTLIYYLEDFKEITEDKIFEIAANKGKYTLLIHSKITIIKYDNNGNEEEEISTFEAGKFYTMDEIDSALSKQCIKYNLEEELEKHWKLVD